ncbi:hypothetical protein PENTCL1PPCAC_604, partial [Pristionchus entomophagus]
HAHRSIPGMLHINLETVLGVFEALLIVYNTGTDSLQGDPLGRLQLTLEMAFLCIIPYYFTNKYFTEDE